MRDQIQTITSAADAATDQDYVPVTGTTVGNKRLLDVAVVSSGPSGDFRSNREKCVNANDTVATLSYLDAGTVNERVSTIVYTSASLGLTATKTLAYAGSAGNYRVSTVTWS